MKFIKLVLISIVVFFVLATTLGLLFPSTVVVSRVVDITAPKDSIFLLIKDINGWKKWMDGLNDTTVNMQNPLKAKLGKTLVTIHPSKQGDTTINAEWISSNNGTQNSLIEIFQQPNQNTTAVHWQFVQHIGWLPWERFASMMSDKIMGTMMEKNLNNLKQLAESR